MAGHRKDIEADLAPGDEPARAEYERDFYSWSIEQARLLREGRTDALDRDNLAEEIESLGREQFNKLVSALRVAIMHMLKWDHQPAKRSRSWMLSIAKVADQLKSRRLVIARYPKGDEAI
jgi:predicted DNA-binding ribbon-helix-helix protein